MADKPTLTRRDLLRAGLGMGALAAASIPGHDPAPSSRTAAAHNGSGESGVDIQVEKSDANPPVDVVRVRVPDDEQGKNIDSIAIDPLGINLNYKDGTSRYLDFSYEFMINQAEESPVRERTRVHIRVVDSDPFDTSAPKRDHIKIHVANPEDSERELAVFMDRELTDPSLGRRARPHVAGFTYELDVSQVEQSPDKRTTVVALDDRIGGDKRGIVMKLSGLNEANETIVKNWNTDQFDYRHTKKYQNEIRLGSLEIRSGFDNEAVFQMQDGTAMVDVIGLKIPKRDSLSRR